MRSWLNSSPVLISARDVILSTCGLIGNGIEPKLANKYKIGRTTTATDIKNNAENIILPNMVGKCTERE